MKKQNMIKIIQEKEAVLFLLIKQNELIFGNESDPHKRARASWDAVTGLMGEMGIEPDYLLPAYIEAHKIMVELLNAKDIAI